MVAMWNCWVAAIRSMDMGIVMAIALVAWRTDIGMLGADLYRMFIYVITMHMV
jgi:hypothetical protein